MDGGWDFQLENANNVIALLRVMLRTQIRHVHAAVGMSETIQTISFSSPCDIML